jgi:hypothetical protein
VPLRRAAPWVERLARIGYAAKGVVYIALGVLGARAAFGSASTPDGSSDALQAMDGSTPGTAVLAFLVIGLFGYAFWRFVQAGLDPESKGSDPSGLATRAGLLLSGLLYAGLGDEAARVLLTDSGTGGDSAEHWAARLMSVPLGSTLVLLAGAGVGVYGLVELYRAWTIDFGKRLALGALSTSSQRLVWWAGRAGHAARGVVFALIGSFVIRAGFERQASEADGLGGALRALQAASPGHWLMAAVAAGLAAYGLFQLVEARYRVIAAG